MTSWCFFPLQFGTKVAGGHCIQNDTTLRQAEPICCNFWQRVPSASSELYSYICLDVSHTQSHTLAQNARMRANADTHSLGALEEGRRQGMRRERSSGTTPTLMLPKQNQPGREGTQTAKTGKREGQGDGRLKHNNAKHGFSRYCSDRQRRCYELIVTN